MFLFSILHTSKFHLICMFPLKYSSPSQAYLKGSEQTHVNKLTKCN